MGKKSSRKHENLTGARFSYPPCIFPLVNVSVLATSLVLAILLRKVLLRLGAGVGSRNGIGYRRESSDLYQCGQNSTMSAWTSPSYAIPA